MESCAFAIGATNKRYYVNGGFVQVAGNVVSVLTGGATPAERLDAEAARAELDMARSRPANSLELLEIRDRQQLAARAKIRVAEKQRAR